MKTKMVVEGIQETINGGIYRDLEGDEDGILYYKDRVMKILIRQALPQDIEIVKEARKREAEKFLAFKKDQFGNKKIIKLSELMLEQSDEEILNAIKMANPVNNDNGDIAIVGFNMRKSRCLFIADIGANDEEAKVGKISFTFFRENVKTEKEERLIKSRVKEIILEANMYTELYEEFVNPLTNQYELKTIE